MGRKSIELTIETKELIVAMSESAKNKAELSRLLNIPRTTITSVLRNCKGMARWRIWSRHCNWKRNSQTEIETVYFFWYRRLNLHDITSKLNKCKAQTFREKTSQRVLQRSKGYKRKSTKKRVVVREVNHKKRVDWCIKRAKKSDSRRIEEKSDIFTVTKVI